MSYNIASAVKGLCLNPEERTVRFKKYRLLLVDVAGRMSRRNCVMRLRLCASEPTIARLRAVWKRCSIWLPRPPPPVPGRAPDSKALLFRPSLWSAAARRRRV